MLKTGLILRRLYDHLAPVAEDRTVADLRIGLSYICAKLDSGSAGLAAVLPESPVCGCTVLHEAGRFAGAPASGLLKNLVEAKDALRRAIGLATANALIKVSGGDQEDREATSTFNLQSGEKVAMVGLFAPLVERIRSAGAVLTVIEKNPERTTVLSSVGKEQALRDCDVAIITATTLLNDSFEETINLLGKPRVVALMGPSTPLIPDIFADVFVTQLGGAVVVDANRVLQIISEGGGTPALRSSLRFVNLMMPS